MRVGTMIANNDNSLGADKVMKEQNDWAVQIYLQAPVCANVSHSKQVAIACSCCLATELHHSMPHVTVCTLSINSETNDNKISNKEDQTYWQRSKWLTRSIGDSASEATHPVSDPATKYSVLLSRLPIRCGPLNMLENWPRNQTTQPQHCCT